MVARLVAVVDEGVEHPEFDVLDIHCLEVGVVHLAHHTAPLVGWAQEMTVGINVGGKVVGTTLVGIECQVEHVERRCRLVAVLSLLRIELAFVNLTHIVVRELFHVALDVAGSEGTAAAREERVNIVPSQQGTVIAVANIVGESAFGEHRWCACLCPVLRRGE